MGIEDRAVTTADYAALEKVSESAIKEKQKFERLVVSKENLLEMFGVCIVLLHSFELSSFATVQQIQEVSHRIQSARRHIHHRLSLRSYD